jgi:hypothetical protein
MLPVLDVNDVIGEVLFVLVLIEVLRLLIVYLQEHRVAVDFMVELGIVATLREIVLRGATELDWKLIAALTAFLAALGAVLRFGDLRLGGAGAGPPGPSSDGGGEGSHNPRAADADRQRR